MPIAKKLPSGSWRCQVFSHRDASGKRIYKSFTCPDPSPKGKRICESEASAWAKEKELHLASSRTFGQAMTDYIDNRRNTLSPRTIEDYERTKRLYLTDLSGIRTDSITQADVQRVIDSLSERLSPKTVANVHCFISAVIRQERPQFALNTTLPQRTRPNINIPSDKTVSALLEAVSGTTLEVPVMLAAFGPMREGEICALDVKNIDGLTVHVCENMIKKLVDGKTTWMIRHPKSAAGDRFIEYPDFVIEKLRDRKGRVTDMNPNTLCKAFKAKLDALGMESFRFHDLRHWCASTLHAQGVPDAYIMERGGWSDDRILKAVYRHTLSDRQKEMTSRANDHFRSLCNMKCNTKKRRPQ